MTDRQNHVTDAVVMVIMSAESITDQSALTDLAATVGASVAYLQVGEPALVDELDRLAATGVTSVKLTRLPGTVTAPARSWLRRVAAHWVRQNPDIQVTVVDSDVTGREAPLTSPAWEQVPNYAHHVLVCRGPRCAAKGASQTMAALTQTLKDRGLGDEDALVAQSGCLFPCNHAPLVAVHPANAWYGPVTPDNVDRIVEEHLIGGHIVSELNHPRLRDQ